jgi:Zn-dependent M28 family amino/carboxypeptidase
MPKDTARIPDLVGRISRANIERDVRYLSTTFPTRHTLGRYADAAAEWIARRLRENGIRDVGFHGYERAGRRLRNVVGAKPGKLRRTILACAHYDSRMQRLDDAESPAPGANDNATGVAALLEVARVLAPLPLSDSLRIVLFSGEEQGLWGSQAYARQLRAERADVHFVFNLDEIGYPPKDRALFVDRDEGGRLPDNDGASAALVERIRTLARTVVKVPTRVDPAEDSDYVPFEAEGYVIAGLYEAGERYPGYHRTDDTMEKVDFAYVTDMARLTTAVLLTEGGLL